MIAAWMAYTMLVGGLLALAALGAEFALRTAGRSVRFVWIAAIAGTFLFAIMAPVRRPTAVNAAPATLVQIAATGARALPPSGWERAMSVVRAAKHALGSPVEMLSLRVATIARSHNAELFTLWAIASSIVCAVFGLAYRRFTRNREDWPRAIVHGVAVCISPDAGPAAMGIAPASIVIPQWVLARTAAEQRLVLAHECEHVRAHDPLLLLVSCVAVAAMPWNAALWFMWSRLRLAVEVDCDARVLRGGAPTTLYGHLLLELSARSARTSALMPAFAFGTSHLEQRLVAMTTRPARRHLARHAASLSICAVALVAACTSVLPTSEQIEKLDVATAATRYPSLTHASFVVDGKPVTFAEASAIPADRIGTIEVSNATKNSRAQRVTIKLNAPTVATLAVGETKPLATMLGDTIVVRTANGTVAVTRGDSAGVRADIQRGGNNGTNGIALDSVAGALARFPIRGDSTRRDPLVFVDGVESVARFNTLNARDIDHVEVLKGRKAVELYGERAANGVISITLKH